MIANVLFRSLVVIPAESQVHLEGPCSGLVPPFRVPPMHPVVGLAYAKEPLSICCFLLLSWPVFLLEKS